MSKKLDPEVVRDRQWLRDGYLVPLNVETDALPEQCPHKDAHGRYVIRMLPGTRTAGEKRWHGFDPATKFQALIWTNGDCDTPPTNVEKRRGRIHWLCGQCGEVMPLGSYES